MYSIKNIVRDISLFSLIATFSGCSAVQNIGVGTAGSMMYKATAEMETETNWNNFKLGAPANLKLLEGLLYLKPNDKNLLVSTIKGYAGYAFAINETQYLSDFYAQSVKADNKEQGIFNYSRALDYGMRFLNGEGVTYEGIVSAMNSKEGIKSYLDSKLSDDEATLEGVLFTAQSLAGLINFQRTDMKLVAQLPVAKGIFDWVCSKNPDINFGTCYIFNGAYEAGRPRMLGGNPEKGKEQFLKGMERFPHNWLIRVAYVQFYLVPMAEEEDYETQKFFMEGAIKRQKNLTMWSPNRDLGEEFTTARLRFYQSLAIKRYQIIKRFEEDLF